MCTPTQLPKTVVIGIGNDLRGDDAIGPESVRRLRGRVPAGTTLRENRGDAMDLIVAWEGAGCAVIVDASANGDVEAGTVRRFQAHGAVLPKDAARCSTHGFGLAEALELASTLGRLPDRVVVYTAEALSFDPGSSLSAEASRACDEICARVVEEISDEAAAGAPPESVE